MEEGLRQERLRRTRVILSKEKFRVMPDEQKFWRHWSKKPSMVSSRARKCLRRPAVASALLARYW